MDFYPREERYSVIVMKLIVNFQTLCKTILPLGSGYSNSMAQNKLLSDHFDIVLSSISSIVEVVQYSCVVFLCNNLKHKTEAITKKYAYALLFGYDP